MVNLHGNYLSFCVFCPAFYEKYLILQEKLRIPFYWERSARVGLSWWAHLQGGVAARAPVHIVTSDDVGVLGTSLLMSQLYFITKQSAPCSLCRLNIKFFSALFVSFLENWFYRLKEINSSALIMLVERYKITWSPIHLLVSHSWKISSISGGTNTTRLTGGKSLVIRGGWTIGIILSNTHSIATSICHLSLR